MRTLRWVVRTEDKIHVTKLAVRRTDHRRTIHQPNLQELQLVTKILSAASESSHYCQLKMPQSLRQPTQTSLRAFDDLLEDVCCPLLHFCLLRPSIDFLPVHALCISYHISRCDRNRRLHLAIYERRVTGLREVQAWAHRPLYIDCGGRKWSAAKFNVRWEATIDKDYVVREWLKFPSLG